MSPAEPMVIHVEWQALLDVYQGLSPDDESLAGWLQLDTGTVTCRAFLGEEFETLVEQGRLLRIPVKAPDENLAQRHTFADSCCDDGLRESLDEALAGARPFHGFQRVLDSVPIEATRWREELREQDQLALERWMARAGLIPEPPAVVKRTVIEFPRRRDG